MLYIVAFWWFLGLLIGDLVARVGVLVFTYCFPGNAFFFLYALRFSCYVLRSAALIVLHGDSPMVKNRMPAYSFLSFRMGRAVGSKELYLRLGFPVLWISRVVGLGDRCFCLVGVLICIWDPALVPGCILTPVVLLPFGMLFLGRPVICISLYGGFEL